MERFCDKCGSLVSGDGGFCPSCGAPMSSVGGVDLTMGSSASGVPTPTGSSFSQQPGYTQSNYSQPNYSQPTYGQTIYPQNNAQNQEMTVGQWFLTIFLSGLGIIGIILLFIWAFSADTPTSKKNYARAMLIFQAIALVLSFVLLPLLMGVVFSVAEGIGGSYMDYNYWASLFTTFLGK